MAGNIKAAEDNITTNASVKRTDIPKNLDECIAQLEKKLKPDEINEIKISQEDDLVKYHFGLGLWIRNNWGLRGNAPLAQWFHGQGVSNPDYISWLIINSFWRHLNGRPILLEEQIKFIQEKFDPNSPINLDNSKKGSPISPPSQAETQIP